MDKSLIFDGTPPSTDLSNFPFWTKVVADMKLASPNAAAARFDEPADWLAFLVGLHGQTPANQLNAVNNWANKKPWVDQMTNWGIPNYWETPGEFIAKGGECADFSICKFYSLLKLGFSENDLRLLVVDDKGHGVFHVVLAINYLAHTWILDNQLAQPTPLLDAPQYVPIYSLTETGWWLHSDPQIDVGGIVISSKGA